jgi:hypothetical protein
MVGPTPAGAKLEAVLGRERGSENPSFPWAETISARLYRFALSGAQRADRRRVSRGDRELVEAAGRGALIGVWALVRCHAELVEASLIFFHC